jgi:pimeloyl-ACP methyl ester carboxylesterase
MKRSMLALLTLVPSLSLAAIASCSSDSSPGGGPTADGGGGTDGAVDGGAGGGFALEVPCTDAPDDVYKDPGALPSEKGAIIKCAKYKDITKADLEAEARKDNTDDGGVPFPGYSGKAFTSGAHVYRVLYRTERGDTKNTAGYSSALVYVPDTPRAATLPLIVASHGSRGQAAKCAASKEDPAADVVKADYVHSVYPLVGSGYVVMVPDLAGYANYEAPNNPPSAYASVADVGKSTLDGARALKKMLSKSLSDKVVITGHSQGGGTALGALALYASYAPELNIVGIAVYSPLWITARANGAFLLFPSTYPIATSVVPKVLTWYMYTHAELLDGQGEGVKIFAPTKQAGVKSFVDNDCWQNTYPDLEALGTSANDLLDPALISAIKNASAGVGDCSGSSDPALCQKWLDRFIADLPHFTDKALSVPILSLYGGQDQTITPDLAACVFDRYKADNAKYKVCFDPAGTHNTIVSFRADYVNDWIAARAMGGAEPAACPNDESALKDDAGARVQCNASLQGL